VRRGGNRGEERALCVNFFCKEQLITKGTALLDHPVYVDLYTVIGDLWYGDNDVDDDDHKNNNNNSSGLLWPIFIK